MTKRSERRATERETQPVDASSTHEPSRPRQGGSYLRQPDGSLNRVESTIAKAEQRRPRKRQRGVTTEGN